MHRLLRMTFVLAFAAGAALVFAWPTTNQLPRPAANCTATPPLAQPAAAAAPATAAAKAPATMLRMPDGSEAAPLNGVTEPGQVVWGNRPYAPIVRTVRHQGIDWYVHSDGTRTTTVRVQRSDTRQLTPVTLVAHPQTEG
jgi:hypothetical protein